MSRTRDLLGHLLHTVTFLVWIVLKKDNQDLFYEMDLDFFEIIVEAKIPHLI